MAFEEESVYFMKDADNPIILSILIQGLVVGSGLGILFGLSDLFFDLKIFKNLSFTIVIIFRVVSHVGITLLLLGMTHYAFNRMSEGQIENLMVEFLDTGPFLKLPSSSSFTQLW